MLGEKDRYHGSALSRLVGGAGSTIGIARLNSSLRTGYIVNDTIAMFVKYSTARLTPWQFGFSVEEIVEIHSIRNALTDAWIVLVCGSDGIAAIPWSWIIDEGQTLQSRLSLQVSRRRNQLYRVTGGLLGSIVVADSSFPSQLLKVPDNFSRQ